MPGLSRDGHYKMISQCLSVRPSVVCLDITQEWKPKIGRMEARDPWSYLQFKRSKIKVTRSINAVTNNAPYAGLGATIFHVSAMLKHVLAIGWTSDVCLSVCHTLVSKWLNILSCFLNHTIAHSFYSFVCIKIFAKFRLGHPCGAAKQLRWGMKMS